MALKDYSDNEAVRSRGQDLVSTLVLFFSYLPVLHRHKTKKNFEHFFLHIIETGVRSKSSPQKAWCNTDIVLPAFSVLRHRGATARRSEPTRVLPRPKPKLDWS